MNVNASVGNTRKSYGKVREFDEDWRVTTVDLMLYPAVLYFECIFPMVSGSYFWLLPLLLSAALLLVPVWWYIAHHNKYTNDVLYTGWTPVIGAMVISRLN